VDNLHFKADSEFLTEKGACALVEDIALHLERGFGHVPKSVANAFADMWKQTLVIRFVPVFELVKPSLWFECMWDLSVAWRSGR